MLKQRASQAIGATSQAIGANWGEQAAEPSQAKALAQP
jgi:hypothetical protein